MRLLLALLVAFPAHAVKLVAERPGQPPLVFCTHISLDPSVIPLCDLCPGYTVSKLGDGIVIRCPGDDALKPFWPLKDCRAAQAQKAATTLLLRCGG